MESISLNLISEFYSNSNNNDPIGNAIASNRLRTLVTNRNLNQKYQHIYNHKVTPELKITDQKSSGRCWLFAALNVVRRSVIEKYNLNVDFELSQSYLFFWDKFERMNYLMEKIIETKDMELSSREVTHLLSDPTCDGGQWDMVANLVRKYGVVPKCVYNESFHSSNSSEMNTILTRKFREYSLNLRDCDNPRELKKEYLKEIYILLVKFLGKPPEKFTWEFIEKDNKFHRHSNLTPNEFYKFFTDFNINEYYCIVDDPRTSNPYNKLYTGKYVGTVSDGNKIIYLKKDIK